jgi:hypothetical protein
VTDRVQVSELAKRLGLRPTPGPRAKTMSEHGRDLSPHVASMGLAGVAMQRQIREAMQRSVPVMREFESAMRETALTIRKIGHAFRVPLRLLLGTKAAREREQVRAMQAWARRRGRRKGRA